MNLLLSKECRPSGKVQQCQQEGITWYQKSTGFSAFVSCHKASFFATGLNESIVFGGPCKLFFLVVSQYYSQICVITRYIRLIYKMTGLWQLVVWVSGMFLLALSEHRYQEAPAGSKDWPKPSHAGEPADSHNLPVKQFRACCSSDCSLCTAISKKDSSVMSIWDAQCRPSEPVFKGEV